MSLWFEVALYVVAPVALWLCLFYVNTRERRVAGAVLLDGGTQPASFVFWILAAFSLIQLTRLALSDSSGPGLWPFSALSVVGLWIVLAVARFQICENGIWRYGDFLPWEKIESWERLDGLLKLQIRSRLPTARSVQLQVPREMGTEIDEILGEMLGGEDPEH